MLFYGAAIKFNKKIKTSVKKIKIGELLFTIKLPRDILDQHTNVLILTLSFSSKTGMPNRDLLAVC